MSERPKRTEKAEEIIKRNGAYLVTETDKYEYYIVKSLNSGKLYDVIFNKTSCNFSCACKNLRLSDCYHVEACRKIQEDPLLQEV